MSARDWELLTARRFLAEKYQREPTTDEVDRYLFVIESENRRRLENGRRIEARLNARMQAEIIAQAMRTSVQSVTEQGRPGRRPDERMVAAYQRAKELMAKGAAKKPASQSAIEQHFPGENEVRKDQLTATLCRYLTPSGRPAWAE